MQGKRDDIPSKMAQSVETYTKVVMWTLTRPKNGVKAPAVDADSH